MMNDKVQSIEQWETNEPPSDLSASTWENYAEFI